MLLLARAGSWPRIWIRQCVSVLTGIELCNQFTNFKANLGKGFCYGLVVIS